MSLESSTYTTVEPTLLKLNEFINQRIKLSDFTVDDKHNLVELFVTHKRTLMQIYQSIFPGTTNMERKYENLSTIQ